MMTSEDDDTVRSVAALDLGGAPQVDESDDDEQEAKDGGMHGKTKQKAHGTDCVVSKSNKTTHGGVQDIKHNTSKPSWWLKLSNPRGTKGQRKVMREMSDHIVCSPRYGEVIDWDDIFPSPSNKDIWFEIGFGLGENLLRLAEMYPDKGIFGADIHRPGSATVLKRIKEAQEQGKYWDGYSLYQEKHDSNASEQPRANVVTATTGKSSDFYANVRINPGNGMKLMQHMPESSLSAVLMTFPDPFPGTQHVEYRLLHVSTCADFHRVLRDGGRFYLATDDEGYFEWCQSIMSHCRHFFVPVEPTPDRSTWLGIVSKYERKGLDEGRQTLLACWEVVRKAEG